MSLPGARWLRRRRALVGLAVHRVVGRLRSSPQRVILSVLGVALAVALVVAVTGVALGLTAESVVQNDDTDFWVVPEQSTAESVAVSSGGVKLGDVHAVSERIERDERVDYATPVALSVVPVTDRTTGETEYVLAAGIIPREGQELFGLSTTPLAPGDPHYANGSYDGPWTGEAVVNDAAASITNTSEGEELQVARTGTNRSFRVLNVSQGEAGFGFGSAPIAVVHLSELQSATGLAESDQADQILVSTNDPAVRSDLASLYPHTTVVTKRGLSAQQASTSNLPLAVGLSALLSALVVGVLFIATLMGLEVSSDRATLGTLATLGFASRSRSLLIGCETLVVAVVGGLVGVAVGAGSIGVVNRVVGAQFGIAEVAVFDPLLVPYGLVVAAVVGVVGSVYPIYLGRRTDILEVLSE